MVRKPISDMEIIEVQEDGESVSNILTDAEKT